MDDTIIAEIRDRRIRIGETAIGEAAEQRRPIQILDVQNNPSALVLDVIVRAGFRALLIVLLLGADRIVGALVVRRKAPGEFPKHTVELLQTFAAQSVLAIQNANLLTEVEEKSRHREPRGSSDDTALCKRRDAPERGGRHALRHRGRFYETTRYRAIFERPSYVTRWRRTGWLGRRDSNLCISESEFVKSHEIAHRLRAD
jgi:hypothetical protein